MRSDTASRYRSADRPCWHSRKVGTYADEVVANVEFLEARARELADQETDRARGLDGKATALLAVIVALIAASAAFAARMPDLAAGQDLRVLWAAEIGLALLFLLAAGGFAVAAVVPRAARTAIHIDELLRWRTEVYLMQDPALVKGSVLNASVHSIGHSRTVNTRKAKRLTVASMLFGAALVSIVALTITLAAHDATREPAQHPTGDRTGTAAGKRHAVGRAHVSHAADGSEARRRTDGGHR